jgi:hypothetical protein
VQKPVFWSGWKCGEVTEFSDSLLMFRIKGVRPEYATERKELTGKDGGALEFQFRSLTDEQLDNRIRELAIKTGIVEAIGRESAEAEDSQA